MLLKNLEVILTYKTLVSQSPPNFFQYFFTSLIREKIYDIALLLIEKKIVDRNILINEYDDLTKKRITITSISILSTISFLKEKSGKVIFTRERWETEYKKAIQYLENKFKKNLDLLRRTTTFRCSINCSQNIYTSRWALDKNYKCINGHRLQSITKEEKEKLIKGLEMDLSMLRSILTPEKIIETIYASVTIKKERKIQKQKITPIFESLQYNIFHINSFFVSMTKKNFFPLFILR